MIEAEYDIDVAAATEVVWRYVEVIPNWAPFMVGFQNVKLVDDRRSIWTVRGDVGILARDVDIQVDITKWEPMSRVEFKLTGITERLTGEGSFDLTAGDPPASVAVGAERGSGASPAVARPAGGWWRRLRNRLAMRLLRWVGRGSTKHPSAGASNAVAASGAADRDAAASSSASEGRSHLAFKLKLAPLGPMAPMVELLMRPMVEPAAEDFMGKLRHALEGRSPDE